MEQEKYKLCLYIAGQTQKSVNAINNLKRYCDEHLHGRFVLEIIDIREHPHLAETEQIIAVPMLIKQLPNPIRKLVGDMSDKEKVLIGLNIIPLPG
jgi:circadian clock protein KaiB